MGSKEKLVFIVDQTKTPVAYLQYYIPIGCKGFHSGFTNEKSKAGRFTTSQAEMIINSLPDCKVVE